MMVKMVELFKHSYVLCLYLFVFYFPEKYTKRHSQTLCALLEEIKHIYIYLYFSSLTFHGTQFRPLMRCFIIS